MTSAGGEERPTPRSTASTVDHPPAGGPEEAGAFDSVTTPVALRALLLHAAREAHRAHDDSVRACDEAMAAKARAESALARVHRWADLVEKTARLIAVAPIETDQTTHP